jgi:hypothetical protein
MIENIEGCPNFGENIPKLYGQLQPTFSKKWGA